MVRHGSKNRHQKDMFERIWTIKLTVKSSKGDEGGWVPNPSFVSC